MFRGSACCLWNLYFTFFRDSFSTYLICFEAQDVASEICILPSSAIASPLTWISRMALISNGQILFGPRARVFKLIIRGVKLAWWSTITHLFNLQERNNALREQGKSLSVERRSLGFEIQNIAKGIRNPTKDYPLQWQRLESGIHGVESRIQVDCLGFPFMGRPYGQPSNQKLNQGIFSENFLVKIHYAHLILQVLNFAIWEKTLKNLRLAKIKIAKVDTRHIHKITKFKLNCCFFIPQKRRN